MISIGYNLAEGWDSNPRRTQRFKCALIQVDSPNLLPMRVRHGAVALNITDDLPVIVADLQAPPVARIINVCEALSVLVRDGESLWGRGGRGAIPLKLEAPSLCRHGSGDQDQSQGQCQGCELTHGRLYVGQDARLPRPLRGPSSLLTRPWQNVSPSVSPT